MVHVRSIPARKFITGSIQSRIEPVINFLRRGFGGVMRLLFTAF